ncbi:MAG: amidohydrolase family protein [Planctomycetes bacterium]|nr:amidohydrolase family protein [Planctomycetota bacterium]
MNPNYDEQVRRGAESLGVLRGFVGYKILAGYYRTPITSDVCKPLSKYANAEKLVVLLHTWGGDECAGWRQVRQIAGACPQVTILMSHSQCGDWDEAIALATDFDGVCRELTAVNAHNGVIMKMVDAGIEDKITFGTDLPWFDPMYGIGSMVFCRIRDEARRKSSATTPRKYSIYVCDHEGRGAGALRYMLKGAPVLPERPGRPKACGVTPLAQRECRGLRGFPCGPLRRP